MKKKDTNPTGEIQTDSNITAKPKYKLTFKDIMIIVLSLTLIATITFSAIMLIYSPCNAFVPVSLPSQDMGTGNEDDSEENTPPPPPSILVSDLKEYARRYNVSIEFLQRFFTDEIVYKNDDGVVFSPIDESLPKSDYVWDNLVQLERELQYQENGEIKSIKGIDVSKYQGNINWKLVAEDGVKFAFMRMGVRGYGTGDIVEDTTWRNNITGALANGIDVGVYFYSQAVTKEEAIAEADFVLERIKDYDVTYPVVFDFEEVPKEESPRTGEMTAAERTDVTIAFCERVREKGYTPMVYGNIKWFVEMVDLTRLTAYDKWFAQYFKTPFFPYDFQIWQYTGKGNVNGVPGDCDINIGFKDYNPATPAFDPVSSEATNSSSSGS